MSFRALSMAMLPFLITHPADRILVVDGAALVTGRMTARVSVAGTIVHVDNR